MKKWKLQEQKDLIQEIYLAWMIENILEKNVWCMDQTEYRGMDSGKIKELFPSIFYYQVETFMRSPEYHLSQDDKLIDVPKEDISLPDEEVEKKTPYFIGGVLDEEKHLIFSFNKNEIVTDAFSIEKDLFQTTLSKGLKDKMNHFVIEMIKHDQTLEDILGGFD